jgi:hypothetical protein
MFFKNTKRWGFLEGIGSKKNQAPNYLANQRRRFNFKNDYFTGNGFNLQNLKGYHNSLRALLLP